MYSGGGRECYVDPRMHASDMQALSLDIRIVERLRLVYYANEISLWSLHKIRIVMWLHSMLLWTERIPDLIPYPAVFQGEPPSKEYCGHGKGIDPSCIASSMAGVSLVERKFSGSDTFGWEFVIQLTASVYFAGLSSKDNGRSH